MTTPPPAADASYGTHTTRPSQAASYAPRSSGGQSAERTGRLPDRKASEVRRMLDVPHPPAPPDLAERAMARGRRLLRRRRAGRTAAWLLLAAAVLAACVALAVSNGISAAPH